MSRDWLQLLTNLAVVAGLGLLIYELNQSRDLVRSQVVDSVYGAAVTRNLALLGESPEKAIAKSVFHPEQVTENDAIVLSQFYTALLVSWLRNKDERGVGYFEDMYAQVVASEAYFLNTVPGRKWWNSVKDLQDPGLRAAVDAALQVATPEQQRGMLERLIGESGRQPVQRQAQ
ncbi:MAG: hypothetical protein AAF529_15165 [Pseudomonadota bacterium]